MHKVDNLLPNSRTQCLKALLAEAAPAEPWWIRFFRALDAAFVPKWKAKS